MMNNNGLSLTTRQLFSPS